MPFARWATEHTLRQVYIALDGILQNLPNRWAAFVIRVLIFDKVIHVDAFDAKAYRALRR